MMGIRFASVPSQRLGCESGQARKGAAVAALIGWWRFAGADRPCNFCLKNSPKNTTMVALL